MERKTFTIDAKDKSLGRIATRASLLLQGKNKAGFDKSKDEGSFVEIVNAKKAKFTGKKFEQKNYHRHSGFPGGLKTTGLKTLYTKNPTSVLRNTVYSMLPKNKLRDRMIKRLRIK